LTPWWCRNGSQKTQRRAAALDSGLRRNDSNRERQQQLRWIPACTGMTAPANGSGRSNAGDVTCTQGRIVDFTLASL
jgi:hypothetical protein